MKLLASVLATVVLATTLLGASAEGRIWVYEFDDETETSAGWVYVGTACETDESGSNDGFVRCYSLNSAPLFDWPEGAPLPAGTHHAPVSILD